MECSGETKRRSILPYDASLGRSAPWPSGDAPRAPVSAVPRWRSGVTIPAEQSEVADYLAKLAGRPAKETHISAVFIGPDCVWKLKKAVRMPFLDFSTTPAREFFIRREFELNTRGAPGLYQAVVPIGRGRDGQLELGAEPAVEWVLRMARIPDGDFVEDIVAAGELTPALLDGLGDCAAAYHAASPPVADWDSAAGLSRITTGNWTSALAAGLPADVATAWRDRMQAAIQVRSAWLNARAAAGLVRRCHGDMHLGNLCLWHGKPVAFDALEFDEALATIDVGYDLAFLLMDLDRRVGRAAANRVMNRYVARAGDLAMAGYPVFLSQRAMIRAHVFAAMGLDYQDYLAAALDYLHPPPGMVVAIGGLQGTGKSTLARALAPDLGAAPGAVILRSDEIRKRLHGVAPEDRLPAAAYSDAANQRTNQALIDAARTASRSGHGVIVDATFLDPAMRRDLQAAVGEPFRGFWLQAPLAVLEARVAARQGDASDATVAVLRRSAERDPGAGDWVPVDATDGAAALACVRDRIAGGAR